MIEMTPQPADPTVHRRSIVRLIASAVSFVLSEKPQLDIRIPFAVTDPASQIVDHPREFEPRIQAVAPAFKNLQNLIAQRRRYFLIGINKEQPRSVRQRLDQIFLSDVAHPGVLIDAVRVLAADLDGPILAETIHHHDLVRPFDAFQAPADIPLFIAGRDTGRYLLAHGRHSFPRASRMASSA